MSIAAQASGKRARRMPLLDRTFLQIETRETPMHVACLPVFKLPKGASAETCRSIVQQLRKPTSLARPWNLKLAPVPLSRLMPAMSVSQDIDMDYHVRHTCLPAPGGERELGELVSHLHSTTLDRSRPLWTCHVIEGLEHNRFALYTKIHHAIIDGVKGAHLMTRCLGSAPGIDNWTPPWEEIERSADRSAQSAQNKRVPLSARQWPKAIVNASLPLFQRRSKEPVRLPFEAPNSILNGTVTTARRVATQQLDLARVKAIAKATDTSINDVFLCLCSSALRRHLMDSHSLPERSLVAGVPISLRGHTADAEAGNAVGFIWAQLGTEYASQLERLQAIRRSTNASKQHIQSMASPARVGYTMATMLPTIAVLLSGQGARIKPSVNVVISNVPGPAHTLYLGEARMEAIYPVSIPFQGLGLNITCLSYDGQLSVGYTGARDSLPHLQRLAGYTAEALDELSAEAGLDLNEPNAASAG